MSMGARFVKWGLGFFVFGVFLTFGVIGHYCVGASADVGELFRRNVTLWWACPWTLSVAIVQGGGLGMVVFGLSSLIARREGAGESQGSLALTLCILGLLGVFAIGYPGYFVFNSIWPDFYYRYDPVGKNAWLLGQAFFFAIYFLGIVFSFNIVRRALDAIPGASVTIAGSGEAS